MYGIARMCFRLYLYIICLHFLNHFYNNKLKFTGCAFKCHIYNKMCFIKLNVLFLNINFFYFTCNMLTIIM